MRTLYLHVGVHRTGTTSTQRFMKDNFDALLQKGCLFPFGVRRHNAQVTRLVRGEVTAQQFAMELQKRADLQVAPVNSIVISDEDMSAIQDFNVFRDLKDAFDVKVVISLRRQDLWLESWYLQNIKWQWNPKLAHLTFEEFFKRRGDFFWVDYAARLAHYEQVFGEGCVVAGVFERADMPDGPIQAFLQMIGITDLSGFGPFVHSNSSLSPLVSEFMRQLPLGAMIDHERFLIEAACTEVDQKLATNGSKLIMTHQQRLIVQTETEQSNSLIAERHFGRPQLFRDPLPGPEAPLADHVLPAQTDEFIAQFVRPFVSAMGKVMAKRRLKSEADIANADARAKKAEATLRAPKARARRLAAAGVVVGAPPPKGA